MSGVKMSLLDKKIAQFCDSSAELLTGIHARHKGGARGRSNQANKLLKTITIPDPDIDAQDEEPLEL